MTVGTIMNLMCVSSSFDFTDFLPMLPKNSMHATLYKRSIFLRIHKKLLAKLPVMQAQGTITV